MTPGTDWLDQARRLFDAVGGTRHAGDAGGAHDAAPDADCRWCPLCQAAAVLRGERPEVTAALADVLTAAATALRTFAGEPDPAPEAPGSDATEPGSAATDGHPDTDRRPPVQRIEIA